MYKTERCTTCGEVKIYDCEQCYNTSDTEEKEAVEKSLETRSSKCLGKCSENKTN